MCKRGQWDFARNMCTYLEISSVLAHVSHGRVALAPSGLRLQEQQTQVAELQQELRSARSEAAAAQASALQVRMSRRCVRIWP